MKGMKGKYDWLFRSWGVAACPQKTFENITWYQVCACGSACARRCMCQGTRVRNGLLLKLQVWDEKHPVPPQDELVIGDMLLEKPAWKPKPKPHVWKAVIFHQYWNNFRHKDWCSMILCFFPGDFLSYRLWHFRGLSFSRRWCVGWCFIMDFPAHLDLDQNLLDYAIFWGDEHPSKLFWCSPEVQGLAHSQVVHNISAQVAGRWRPRPTIPLSRPTSNASKWSTGAARAGV